VGKGIGSRQRFSKWHHVIDLHNTTSIPHPTTRTPKHTQPHLYSHGAQQLMVEYLTKMIDGVIVAVGGVIGTVGGVFIGALAGASVGLVVGAGVALLVNASVFFNSMECNGLKKKQTSNFSKIGQALVDAAHSNTRTQEHHPTSMSDTDPDIRNAFLGQLVGALVGLIVGGYVMLVRAAVIPVPVISVTVHEALAAVLYVSVIVLEQYRDAGRKRRRRVGIHTPQPTSSSLPPPLKTTRPNDPHRDTTHQKVHLCVIHASGCSCMTPQYQQLRHGARTGCLCGPHVPALPHHRAGLRHRGRCRAVVCADPCDP
jgi:hypothetical protein